MPESADGGSTTPAPLLDLAFALYEKRRVNPDHRQSIWPDLLAEYSL